MEMYETGELHEALGVDTPQEEGALGVPAADHAPLSIENRL